MHGLKLLVCFVGRISLLAGLIMCRHISPKYLYLWKKLIGEYTKELEHAEGYALDFNDMSEERFKKIQSIFNFAAYLHHIITHTHPFREGNGRTARLAGNLVLEPIWIGWYFD